MQTFTYILKFNFCYLPIVFSNVQNLMPEKFQGKETTVSEMPLGFQYSGRFCPESDGCTQPYSPDAG